MCSLSTVLSMALCVMEYFVHWFKEQQVIIVVMIKDKVKMF